MLTRRIRTTEIVQWIKAVANKTDNLSLIPGTYMVKEGEPTLQVVP